MPFNEVELNYTTLAALLVESFLQVLFITEIYVFMPIFHKGDILKKRMLYHTKTSYCLTLSLIALIYAPRLLNVSIILESLDLDGFYIIYILLGMFLPHTFCFVILIVTMYRDEWRKIKLPLFQSYFTSLMAPCIVMSPDSKLLLFSNLVSMIPHVISASLMIAFAKNTGMENSDGIARLFSTLIPWLLISPMFAWLLQVYSQEKTQEILVNGFSLKLVKFFGSTFVLRALDEVSDILTAMDYL